jgi:hypothetical protein
MANTQKSWKGKPTTNILSMTNWNNSLAGWSGPFWLAVDRAFINDDALFSGVTVLKSTAQSVANGGVSYIDIGLPTGATAGITYTCSVWYKSSARASMIWTHDTLGNSTSAVIALPANGTWQQAVCTAVSTASGAIRFHLGFAGGAIGDVMYFTAPQIEQNSYATPFVNGTRSNTQALIDISGNYALTVSSLTYASDNTFSYNGDTVYTPTTTLNLSAGVSMEMVFKCADIQTRQQGFMSFSEAPHYINFWAPGNGSLRWENWVNTNSSTGGTIFSPTNLVNNTWYHAVGTYANNGTAILYINGVQVATSTYAAASYGLSSTYISFGSYAGYLLGSMPVSRVYTRPLTAVEVAQNFNAIRGRYGL